MRYLRIEILPTSIAKQLPELVKTARGATITVFVFSALFLLGTSGIAFYYKASALGQIAAIISLFYVVVMSCVMIHAFLFSAKSNLSEPDPTNPDKNKKQHHNTIHKELNKESKNLSSTTILNDDTSNPNQANYLLIKQKNILLTHYAKSLRLDNDTFNLFIKSDKIIKFNQLNLVHKITQDKSATILFVSNKNKCYYHLKISALLNHLILIMKIEQINKYNMTFKNKSTVHANLKDHKFHEKINNKTLEDLSKKTIIESIAFKTSIDRTRNTNKTFHFNYIDGSRNCVYIKSEHDSNIKSSKGQINRAAIKLELFSHSFYSNN